MINHTAITVPTLQCDLYITGFHTGGWEREKGGYPHTTSPPPRSGYTTSIIYKPNNCVMRAVRYIGYTCKQEYIIEREGEYPTTL